MFLSGSRDTMNRLYGAAKELKAIERIISNMRDEKVQRITSSINWHRTLV
jgi:hypothetical protein